MTRLLLSALALALLLPATADAKVKVSILGWTTEALGDTPQVKSFPHVAEIVKAKDTGAFLPRTPVWSELADAMHRATQKVMLTNADIKTALNEAAAEVDRATAGFKKG